MLGVFGLLIKVRKVISQKLKSEKSDRGVVD